MRTSKLGAVIFAAALGAGWIGCAADATPPDKGPERVASQSSAITYPPPPDCSTQQWITVKAARHTTTYNASFAPSNYSVSAYYGGQSSAGYAIPCGSPVSQSTGYMTTCGSDPNTYEKDVWSQVYRSNGYAYVVYTENGNQQSGWFVGVGINSSTASPAWSYTPPPPPGHPGGGSPTTADWDAELNLASSALGKAPDVQATHLTCVLVEAQDTGQVLDFFPVMDVHDPLNPPW